ncbi:hypothetical protein OS493_006146 [Desmophyllum pertusum]|uniref:Uncharacterized protein n=1 Tax=Desmophyllum pertusum TaxID=174260 RepID=A0A9X0DAV9_9CNID|nr:hypothetical protein OS493_006146 [Desmophyllum pertusum]
MVRNYYGVFVWQGDIGDAVVIACNIFNFPRVRHVAISLCENKWHGEQPTDEVPHCANCHLLKSEYGRVLFERDLAQRNLRIVNYRLGDKLQEQRNKEDYDEIVHEDKLIRLIALQGLQLLFMIRKTTWNVCTTNQGNPAPG